MTSPDTVDPFAAGTIIELADITQLRPLEDLIARQVNPSFDRTTLWRDAWDARTETKNLLRPEKFNGRIADISLQVMDEPYERLNDARSRGWKIGNGGNFLREGLFNKDTITNYIGLTLTGNCISSGRGVIGQLQSELWYFPTPKRQLNTGSITTTTYSYGGRPIAIIVAKPRIEPEKIIQLNETSRRIGFAVLQREMMHPIVQPIRM